MTQRLFLKLCSWNQSFQKRLRFSVFFPNSDLDGTPNGTQYPIGFKWAVWNNYVKKAISRLIFTHHLLGNILKYLLIC